MTHEGSSGGMQMGLDSLFSPQSDLSFPSVFQKLVDDLPEQIALVDEKWNILSVNRSWARAVAEVGFTNLSPGSNYKAFCASEGAGGRKAKSLIAPALEELDRGERTSFALTYSGDGALAGRDYETRIALFHIGSQRFATITRTDLTELVYLRQLRETLTGSLDETRHSERERIARELHDSTMQFLIGAALSLGHLRRSGIGLQARALVSEIEALLVKAQDELRSISFLAHAHELEGLGLAPAVTAVVDGFARRAGLEASVEIVEPLPLPTKDAQIALYRVVQEALSNVHRHARCSRIAVRLVTRGPALHLIVADNGIGFPKTVNMGVGLQSMQSRLREIGGKLRIRHLAQGTAIVASAPLAQKPFDTGD